MSQIKDIDSNEPKNEFEQAELERELSLVREFLVFVAAERKWWLIPILLVLGVAGLMVVLGSTGAAPFIYTLF